MEYSRTEGRIAGSDAGRVVPFFGGFGNTLPVAAFMLWRYAKSSQSLLPPISNIGNFASMDTIIDLMELA